VENAAGDRAFGVARQANVTLAALRAVVGAINRLG